MAIFKWVSLTSATIHCSSFHFYSVLRYHTAPSNRGYSCLPFAVSEMVFPPSCRFEFTPFNHYPLEFTPFNHYPLEFTPFNNYPWHPVWVSPVVSIKWTNDSVDKTQNEPCRACILVKLLLNSLAGSFLKMLNPGSTTHVVFAAVTFFLIHVNDYNVSF